MISVCMATKNGARYLAEQIDSILKQLSPADEFIIADDCSGDETIQIIKSYHDSRIRLIQHKSPQGIAKNFETSLKASKGQFIFLADQDDIWVPSKIKIMTDYLNYYDLVISDCVLTDQALRTRTKSFYSLNNSGKGLIKNIFKNSYIGCCMAFNRKLLTRALPFPKDIPIHDFWLGLIGDLYFNVHFIEEALVYHRRHSANASSTGGQSVLSLQKKIANRCTIIKNLFLHKAYAA